MVGAGGVAFLANDKEQAEVAHAFGEQVFDIIGALFLLAGAVFCLVNPSTKADKLAYGAAKNALLKVRQEVHQGWGDVASLQLFSAPKRLGVEEAQQVLASWLGLLDEEEESEEA